MKKFIAVALVLAVVITGVALKVNYDRTHFEGHIYNRNSGVSYDNGIAKGDVWTYSGVTNTYSIDELRVLGQNHKVKLTGLFSGPKGVAIELMSDTILVVPGVGLEDGIAETYGLF